MQMRIEKWETAVDIKGALDKLPKMATGGMILAVINDVLKNVQYAPTTGALTITLEEARAIREGFLGETGCLAMQRVVNVVLSRRTAEPQPAAEPSPAPVDKPSPADAQGDLATPIGDSSFADKICEILYRRVGMGRLDNDPIAKEIIAVAQDHPPAGWVSVEDRDADWEKAIHAEFVNTHGVVLANIRARLNTVEKTPEARVLVMRVSYGTFGWRVFVDQEKRGTFNTEDDATIFRLGIIESLKKEGK